MLTVTGRVSFAGPSPYQSLQIERARMAAANQQAESAGAALASAIGDSAVQLSQGLADLAAQQALTRVNAAVSAQQPAAATPDDVADDAPVDPYTAVDEAMNGIDDLIASTAAQFADGGDALTDINQIIDGTAGIADESDVGEQDGASLFGVIDSIINSFVPPPPPSVDLTV